MRALSLQKLEDLLKVQLTLNNVGVRGANP